MSCLRRPSPRWAARRKWRALGRDWLWRMVEGAVVDALGEHPDYLTDRGRQLAVGSITKRVVGTLAGHSEELRKEGRNRGLQVEGAGRRPDRGRLDIGRSGPRRAESAAGAHSEGGAG